MTAPIPDEMSQRKRIALIVAGSVVAVALVTLGAWVAMRPRTAPVVRRTFTPAEETTASGPATSSAVASALAGEGTSGSVGPGSGTDASATIARNPKIVFRLGRSLYVANEDGTGAVGLKVTEAEYALSPDGAYLAVIRGGKLVIIVVATGKSVVVGSAELVSPVWTPDSSAVLFVRAGTDGVPAVWRVVRRGGTPARVAAGQGVAISPDGRVLALLPTEADSGSPHVTVITAGSAPASIAVSGGGPIACSLSNTRLYVSTLSPEGTTAIWCSALDGSGRRELVGAIPAGGKAATYGRLLLSPNGTILTYTADGDDGYSRIWVVPVAGGSPRQVTSRRDGYPLGWTADGADILFFEGNSFQGEPSALWRSSPDGANRHMIVSGAVQ